MILEELCINENTGESSEIIDVEAICDDNDFKRITIQAGKSSNLKTTIVAEKIKTNVASVVPDAEMRIEKEDNDVDMKTDSDINMKEIQREETQKSQKSVKTQASRCTNKNPFKHNACKNMQDEIQAKRTKYQKENSKDSGDVATVPQPLSSVKEIDSKSSSSMPKVVSVESVHYNIAPISKFVRQPSMYSPTHFECCNSVSSFGFMSKGC